MKFDLKILMFLTWIISIAFSIWLFWIGFGIYMTAGSNQECFPVYFSMWPTLILVIFSFFSPRIGGALLMGNAVNFSILFFIETFCVPGLSVPSVIHNFIVYSQKYYFFLNIPRYFRLTVLRCLMDHSYYTFLNFANIYLRR